MAARSSTNPAPRSVTTTDSSPSRAGQPDLGVACRRRAWPRWSAPRTPRSRPRPRRRRRTGAPAAVGPADTRTANGSRAVRASTAATRPPSDSTGGWMPCASSRRSASRSRMSTPSSVERVVGGPFTAADLVAGQAQLHHQRDDLLLDAVVDVALDPAALGVGRGHEAGAGPVEFGQPLGELGGQPHVGDGRGRLAGQGGQQLPVLLVVAVGPGPALDHARPRFGMLPVAADPVLERHRQARHRRSAHRSTTASTPGHARPGPTARPARAGPCRRAGAAGRATATVCSRPAPKSVSSR